MKRELQEREDVNLASRGKAKKWVRRKGVERDRLFYGQRGEAIVEKE